MSRSAVDHANAKLPALVQVLGHSMRLTPSQSARSATVQVRAAQTTAAALSLPSAASQAVLDAIAAVGPDAFTVSFTALALTVNPGNTSKASWIAAVLPDLTPTPGAPPDQYHTAARLIIWNSRALLARRRTVAFCDPQAGADAPLLPLDRLATIAPCAVEPSGLRLYACRAIGFLGSLDAFAEDGYDPRRLLTPCLLGIGPHGRLVEAHEDPQAISARLAQANMRTLRGVQAPLPTNTGNPDPAADSPRTRRVRP